MRIAIVASLTNRCAAERRQLLVHHVAIKALLETHKIRAPGSLAPAELLSTMSRARTLNQLLLEYSLPLITHFTRFLICVSQFKNGALPSVDAVELFKVLSERHDRWVAVVIRIGGIVGSFVDEVFHVNLHAAEVGL
ncbi:MAG: hypothetical protein Q9164_006901, partial [Protoblastenia rupestris]